MVWFENMRSNLSPIQSVSAAAAAEQNTRRKEHEAAVSSPPAYARDPVVLKSNSINIESDRYVTVIASGSLSQSEQSNFGFED